MRIKFLKGDPRAGMVVEIDGELGTQHIERGYAEQVSAGTDPSPATPSAEEMVVRTATAKAAKKTTAKAAKK